MVEQHGLKWSAFLHLFPGILITFVFVLVAPLLRDAGLPVVTGILLAIAIVLVPFQLGMILFDSKKEYGHYSLKPALL